MLNQISILQAMLVGWVRSHLPVKDDTGASLVEYALLLALIAVVAIGALVLLGGTVNNMLNNVTNAINSAP